MVCSFKGAVTRGIMLCLILCAASSAWATTYYWRSDVDSGSIGDAANWCTDSSDPSGSVSSSAPGSSDGICFTTSPTVTIPYNEYKVGGIDVGSGVVTFVSNDSSTKDIAIYGNITGSGTLKLNLAGINGWGGTRSIACDVEIEGSCRVQSGNITFNGTVLVSGTLRCNNQNPVVTFNGDVTLPESSSRLEVSSHLVINGHMSGKGQVSYVASKNISGTGTVLLRDGSTYPASYGVLIHALNFNGKEEDVGLIQLTSGGESSDDASRYEDTDNGKACRMINSEAPKTTMYGGNAKVKDYQGSDFAIVVRAKTQASENKMLWAFGQSGNGFGLRTNADGQVQFVAWSNNNPVSSSAFSSVDTPTTRYHVYAIIYDATNHKIAFYADGIQVGYLVDYTVALVGNQYQFGAIHAHATGVGTAATDIYLDDFRFYKNALTPEQLATHYTRNMWPATSYSASVDENTDWEYISWNEADFKALPDTAYSVTVSKEATLTIDLPKTVGSIQFDGTGSLKANGTLTGDVAVNNDMTLTFDNAGDALAVSGSFTVAEGKTLMLSAPTISEGSTALLSAASISGAIELNPISEAGYTYSLLNKGTSVRLVRLSDASFTYNGWETNPSGWFDTWQWDTTKNKFSARPDSSNPFVPIVTSSWHPGSSITPPSSFTFSVLADVSAVDRSAKNYVMAAIGNGNKNRFIVMYCREGYVRLGNFSEGNWTGSTTLGIAIPTTPGYHLWTATCNSDGTLALYRDNGIVTEEHQSANPANALSMPESGSGLQIGNVWGGHGSFLTGDGVVFASIRGYDEALNADQVAVLARSFPPSGETVSVTLDSTNDADSIDLTNQELTVPAGYTISARRMRANNSNSDQPVTLNLAGTINITSEENNEPNIWYANAYGSHFGGIMFGHWAGTGVYNITGSLLGENAYLQTVYTAGSQTININGGTVSVRGLYAYDGHNDSTVNLSNGGVLQVKEIPTSAHAYDGSTVGAGTIINNFGYGTYRITGGDATVASAINFTGTEAEPTTIDPYGNTITMNAAALTGSGYIKIASGTTGKVVFKGSHADFSGGVVIEPNAAVVEFENTTAYKGSTSVAGFACSVTDGNKLTYYPTFADAIAGAGGKDIAVYNYTDQTLPDHYRVRSNKLELIPGTIFSVY